MSTIKLLSLKNFASVREAEYKLGRFNIISGKNAQGKTTILSAMRYAFNGGNEAELITQGEKNGEVVLVLDDGSKARRRIAPESKSGKFQLTDQTGYAGHGVSEWKRHFDTYSIDPMQFLRAKNEEQTKLFLAAMPLTLSDADVQEATGDASVTLRGEHPMTAIKRIYDSLYDQRTDVNRAVKQAEIHIGQLRETLPAKVNLEEDPTLEITRLEERKELIENTRLQRKTQYHDDATSSLEKLDIERRRRMQEISDWYDAEKASITAARDERIASMMQKSEADYAPVCEQLIGLRANSQNVIVWKSTKLTIDNAEKELESTKQEQLRLNTAMNAVEALRDGLMANLPIAGVEIIDGVIHVSGTSINQLSQSEAIRFAVRVATMRLGDIRAVIVDSGECMDSSSFEELIQICDESDVQLIVTMVTDADGVTIDSTDVAIEATSAAQTRRNGKAKKAELV